jgi:uncharacterized protein YjbJ (UPF0337 family)
MGAQDRLANTADRVKGEVKEAVGSATDDSDLEAQGKRDQAESRLRDAAEDVKDAVKRAFD